MDGFGVPPRLRKPRFEASQASGPSETPSSMTMDVPHQFHLEFQAILRHQGSSKKRAEVDIASVTDVVSVQSSLMEICKISISIRYPWDTLWLFNIAMV